MVRRGLILFAAVFFLILAGCASKQEDDNVAVPPANIIRPLPSRSKPQAKKESPKETAVVPETKEEKKEEAKPETVEKAEETPVEEPEPVEEPAAEPPAPPVEEPEPVYEDPDVAPATITLAVQTEREKAPKPVYDPDPEPVAEVKPVTQKTETKTQTKTETKKETKTQVKTETPKKTETPSVTVKKEEPKAVEVPKNGTKTEVRQETKKEETKQDAKKNEEYERSVGKSTTPAVTIQVFEEDKKDILNIISKLDTVMKNRDYKTWLTYLNDESIRYWSNRSNLAKAENRLPVKGLQLRNLEDYFKYVFIPSRSGRRVDEIRYENDRQVKAVQVNDNTDVVYYNFEKDANGIWKLRLPSNSD